jgi:hypothetical protein
MKEMIRAGTKKSLFTNPKILKKPMIFSMNSRLLSKLSIQRYFPQIQAPTNHKIPKTLKMKRKNQRIHLKINKSVGWPKMLLHPSNKVKKIAKRQTHRLHKQKCQ